MHVPRTRAALCKKGKASKRTRPKKIPPRTYCDAIPTTSRVAGANCCDAIPGVASQQFAPATLDVVGMASQYVRGGIFFGRVRFDAFPFLHNAARVRGTCIEMPTKPIFGQSNRLAALPGV